MHSTRLGPPRFPRARVYHRMFWVSADRSLPIPVRSLGTNPQPPRSHSRITFPSCLCRSRSTPSRFYGSPSLSSRSSNSISRESTLPAPAFSSLLLHARHLTRTNPFSSPRFIPIVALALVFNVTNAIGFTYACVPQNPRSACN